MMNYIMYNKLLMTLTMLVMMFLNNSYYFLKIALNNVSLLEFKIHFYLDFTSFMFLMILMFVYFCVM